MNTEKLDNLIADLNALGELNDDSLDGYADCLEFNFDSINCSDAEEAINEALTFLNKAQVKQLIADNTSVELGTIHYSYGCLTSVSIGEREFQCDELGVLSQEEKDYVAKNGEFYYSGTGNLIYFNNSYDCAELILDIDVFKEGAQEFKRDNESA